MKFVLEVAYQVFLSEKVCLQAKQGHIRELLGVKCDRKGEDDRG